MRFQDDGQVVNRMPRERWAVLTQRTSRRLSLPQRIMVELGLSLNVLSFKPA